MLDIPDVRPPFEPKARPPHADEPPAPPSVFNPPLIALTVTTVLIAVSLILVVLDGDHVSAAETRGRAPAATSCAVRPGR